MCPRNSYSNLQGTACLACPFGTGTENRGSCHSSDCKVTVSEDAAPEASSPFSRYNSMPDEPPSPSDSNRYEIDEGSSSSDSQHYNELPSSTRLRYDKYYGDQNAPNKPNKPNKPH